MRVRARRVDFKSVRQARGPHAGDRGPKCSDRVRSIRSMDQGIATPSGKRRSRSEWRCGMPSRSHSHGRAIPVVNLLARLEYDAGFGGDVG